MWLKESVAHNKFGRMRWMAHRTHRSDEIKGITEYGNRKLSWKWQKKREEDSNEKTKEKISVHNVLENRSTWLIFHATNIPKVKTSRAHTQQYFISMLRSFHLLNLYRICIRVWTRQHVSVSQCVYAYVRVLYVCGYRSCRSYAIIKFKVKKKTETNGKKSRTLSTVNIQTHRLHNSLKRAKSHVRQKSNNN